jgi:putative FmdB family regulatory protein
MPLYEYVCQSCGKKTEVLQRVGEKPLKLCPHCGGKLKKAFSAPAVHFKGSGWYVTDYARAKKEEKSSHGSKSDSDAKSSETKKEKTSETKSESKKDSKKAP